MPRSMQTITKLYIAFFLAFFTQLAWAQDTGNFLDPDQAYQFSARVVDANHIEATWKSAPGYYLYKDKMKLSVEPANVKLGAYQLPAGVFHNDETFGRQEVYPGRTISVVIPLEIQGAAPSAITLTSKYQGCAEAGVCYPPATKVIKLSLSGAGNPSTVSPTDNASGPAGAGDLSEQDKFAKIMQGNLLVTVGLFFLAGLGLSFTPCIFPMFPILSAIIVGQGQQGNPRRAFLLSSTYVLGMALTYTIVGMIAGKTGAYLQAFFQSPWVLISFSLVFVLLSLSMFGFYNLQMPASVQAKLSSMGQGGNLLGTFVMGALSALIVGPCVAAPLAGALLYISQTGDVLLGGISLFALSIGMGLPLLLICTSACQFLPRAGQWMDNVKAIFGVLLLGVAIWMISRILPAWATLSLWALLLILSGVYLRATDSLPDTASGWTRLGKGIGIVLLAYGLLLGLGAVSGAKDPVNPLEGLSLASSGPGTQASPAGEGPQFKSVSTAQELQSALAAAKGKPVLLDFYADWCVECVRMENTTFKDPAVRQALSRFTLLRADVTANSAAQRALLHQFQLVGPPAILIFDGQGQEIRRARLVGYKDAQDFIRYLNSASS